MLSHLQLDQDVLARIDRRVAREHEERLYRPTAVAIVASPMGDMLVVRSKKSRRWSPPQGGIERGESAIMGLFRELKEEVGVGVSVVKDCRFCHAARLKTHESRGFALGKSYYFFYVKCHTVPELTLQEDEVVDSAWLAPHEVGDFLMGREKLRQLPVRLAALERAWRQT